VRVLLIALCLMFAVSCGGGGDPIVELAEGSVGTFEGGGAAISGTLTRGGGPLDGVSVRVTNPEAGSDDWREVAISDARGRFSAELEPGVYLVRFDPSEPGLDRSFYPDASFRDGAEAVTLGAGEELNLELEYL